MNIRRRWLFAIIPIVLIAAAAVVWRTQIPRTPNPQPQSPDLHVLTQSPKGDEVPIAADGITVMFDHAMVPLTTLDAGRDQRIDLTITPAVEGKFFWLGTHGFIFRPTKPFDPATTYRVTLPAGLASVDGVALPAPIAWEFSTVRPRVRSWEPRSDGVLLPKQGMIGLRFNVAMDRADVEKKFLVTNADTHQEISTGRKFLWSDTDHVATVRFTDALPWGAKIIARLPAGARAKVGALGSTEDVEATYEMPAKTVTIEKVGAYGEGRSIALEPNTDTELPAVSGICYAFSQAIQPASFEKAFQLKPAKKSSHKPYFYFEDRDYFTTVDAEGRVDDLEGFRTGCVAFLDEYNQSFRFSLDPKRIVALSGAQPSATSDAYLVHTGHAAPAMESRLTKNVFSLDGALTIPYRVTNLKALRLRLYRLTDTAQYNANFLGRTLALKRHKDPATKQMVDDEPTVSQPLTYGGAFTVPIDRATMTIDQARMPATMATALPIDTPVDASKLVHADLSALREQQKLSPGLYLLETIPAASIAQQSPRAVYSMIQVTPVGLATKREIDHVMVWATDIERGVPIADVPIHVECRQKDAPPVTADGVTNAQGIVIFPGDWRSEVGDCLCASVTDPVRAAYSCEAEHAIAGSRVLGVAPTYFTYVYTDRPIYRPGQTVYYSSFIRQVKEGRYFAPKGDLTANVTVTDAEGTEIYSDESAKIAGGVVHGTFDLADNADLPRGTYTVSIHVGSQAFSRNFFVASYRKPSFKVDLKSQRLEIVSGDDIQTSVQGDYFFGAPMRKAPVDWSIMTTTYRFAPDGYDGFYFIDDDLLEASRSEADDGEYDYASEYEYSRVASSGATEDADHGEDPRGDGATRQGGSFFVEEGKGVMGRPAALDDAGALVIHYRPDLKKYPTSQTLSLEAKVEDPAHQEVAAAEEIIVHKANYYLGVRPQQWVVGASTPAVIDVVSLDTEGKAVGGKRYAADVVRREYQFIQRRNANGFWEYTFEHKDTTIEQIGGATDAEGKGAMTFTPKEGGTYRIVVKGRDDKGRTMQSATQISVWGAGYVPWRMDEPETVELVPDKDMYKVGDTAHVLVKSLVPVTQALMTLERGRLLDYRLIELGGNAAHIDIPITEGMAPNVFVSVVAHVGRQEGHPPMLFRGETELHVDTERKRLAVTITPDKKSVVRRPSSVVGESADDRRPATGDAVPIYRPGDTVKVRVETKDPTGRPRKAHVIVSVADESVLRLLDYKLPDLIKRFYYRRANGVRTASLLRSLKAGDGGMAAGKKRRIFKDTAHFEAHLQTNDKGIGEFRFPLPDDLTTWVIEAVAVSESKSMETFEKERAALAPQQPEGVRALEAELTLTDDTFVGGARAKIMSTLPVLVRPALPRFAVWGDRVIGSVIANNQHPTPVKGTLTVSVAGDAVLADDKPAVDIPFEVPAQSEAVYPIDLRITHGVGRLIFSAAAKSVEGKPFDAVEITLPVQDRFAPETVATSGMTATAVQEQVAIPKDIIAEKGGLEVAFKASLGLAVAQPLRNLIDYPWGCSEQRSSALLGLLMARQMSAKYGEQYFESLAPLRANEVPPAKTPFPEKLKLLDRKIIAILDELTGRFQHPDGGMRYWPEDDEASFYASVQTLWAFTLAKELHYEVAPSAVTDLAKFIQRELERDTAARQWRFTVPSNTRVFRLIGYVLSELRYDARRRSDEIAYGLWGLSLNHGWDAAVAERLLKKPAELSASGSAYLLMALANHGDKGSLTPMADRLKSLAEQSPRHTSWPKSPFFWSSAVKNTALAARALLAADAHDPLMARALAFLLNRKHTLQTVSTQDDLHLAAFAYEYAKTMKEDATHYTGYFDIGGKRLIEQSYGLKNLLEERRQHFAMKDLTAFPMPANIAVGKEGTGTLYYDMLLKYYLAPEHTPTREEGLVIAREYYGLDDVKEAHPLTQFTVGENYKGHITLIVPQELNYVLVQDLLPAGFEPIDMTLATSSRAAQRMAEQGGSGYADDGEEWRSGFYDDVIHVEDYGMDWGFRHQEIRDDSIVWSDKFVPPGVYHLRYPVRATTAGTYLAPGATAFEFYEPEVFGRSRTRMIEIAGRK